MWDTLLRIHFRETTIYVRGGTESVRGKIRSGQEDHPNPGTGKYAFFRRTSAGYESAEGRRLKIFGPGFVPGYTEVYLYVQNPLNEEPSDGGRMEAEVKDFSVL